MGNPFENADGTFRVLVNQANQHSLWPDFLDVPDGWSSTYGPDSREECLNYVESNWNDLRPRSIAS
ncbi:MbtH family protein [Kitasatospora sp. NPDC059811]|uniref:MbtH family protein n=1 Tax=Streptomycetaceae TaxID=2062 RepID=UPI0007AF2EED|nr:MbtH family protein [Streptomyces sp. MJM8645]